MAYFGKTTKSWAAGVTAVADEASGWNAAQECRERAGMRERPAGSVDFARFEEADGGMPFLRHLQIHAVGREVDVVAGAVER